MITIEKITTENQESTNVNTTDACGLLFCAKTFIVRGERLLVSHHNFSHGRQAFCHFRFETLVTWKAFCCCAPNKVFCLPFCFVTNVENCF